MQAVDKVAHGLFAAGLTVVAWAAAPAPWQTRFVFAVNHAEVVVPVTVTNHNGNVPGLIAGDFHIFENGRSLPIAGFEAGDATVTVGLVVDHSQSMGRRLPEVGAAAEAFARAGNPGDEMFVVNFNDEVRLELPPGVLFAPTPGQLDAAVMAEPTGGRTAMYDALMDALDHLAAGASGRRALVLVSDGGDNASRHTLAQVREAALRAQAVIYVVGFNDDSDADSNPGVLRQLAAATGGSATFVDTAAEAAAATLRVAGELRQQYTLLYVPPRGALAGYRAISVKVAAPGYGHLTVRTRSGYYAR